MQAHIKELIEKYDINNVFESMSLFPEQCKAAWRTPAASSKTKEVKHILITGMGGSALGGYMLQSLNITTVPLVISNDYSIPAWVSEDTLVLAMSYSGTTEETVSATKQAIEKGAAIIAITTGGALATLATENNIPVHLVDTTKNPCGQPRFCVGAMMMEILKACDIYGVSKLSKQDVESALTELQAWVGNFKETDRIDQVYTEALAIKDAIPVLIHSEHLANVGRFMRNQINETGKTFAVAHELPELNHHLLEGLEFPKSNTDKLHFMFFESAHFTDKIKKRIAVTKDVLTKQGIAHTSVAVEGSTLLVQVLTSMYRDMNTAYLLGLIHEKNPSEINWVNYFKTQLAS